MPFSIRNGKCWEPVGRLFVTGFGQEKSLGAFFWCGFQSKHERNSFPLQYLDWLDWKFGYQPPHLPPADFKKGEGQGGDETSSANTTACSIWVSVSDQLQGWSLRRKCGEAALGARRGAGTGCDCWSGPDSADPRFLAVTYSRRLKWQNCCWSKCTD